MCNCSDTPHTSPDTPQKANYFTILKNTKERILNKTREKKITAIINDQTFTGTGLLTYVDNENSVVSHYLQIFLDGQNTPYIPPLSGKGFITRTSYQSYSKSHNFITDFISETENIYILDSQIQITASPSCGCDCPGGYCYECECFAL